MRTERFPHQRRSKLLLRGDGPFRVLEKVNDNAYKLELPGEMNISPTFNVTDLAPFHAGDPVLPSEPFLEGGNDEDIETSLTLADEESINIPTMRHAPRTRSGTKSLREEFNKSIEGLITLIEHEELKEKLLKGEITRETPMEPLTKFSTLETQQDDVEDSAGSSQDLQEAKKVKEIPSNDFSLLKRQAISFLPVLQGIKDATTFVISKQVEIALIKPM
ncbi:uncharacterized protein LOC112088136 [Eutrema salsugineum]|uniref:uncharacterized protein LOC112088136 n=1 Tax=Eutrema salsugineum TaxID=72664 RepID=UPI000CED1100|nr:uncharacterized protein LOC112088136 [Eutrema salsugineum]XP_024014089.1 uncharacterized protein LOC112088136 [Eutrema salsugineum]XP_024014091.1 uncharacterized protein LOC112088136 [Eutrema salsugineum]